MEILRFVLLALLFLVAFIVGTGTLITIPAMLSLPKGIRPGLDKLTIDQALDKLASSGKSCWDLVREARNLVETESAIADEITINISERHFSGGMVFVSRKHLPWAIY